MARNGRTLSYEPLPTDPGWRAHVERMIAKMEAWLTRDPSSVYARLCLQGWRAELMRVAEAEGYWRQQHEVVREVE